MEPIFQKHLFSPQTFTQKHPVVEECKKNILSGCQGLSSTEHTEKKIGAIRVKLICVGDSKLGSLPGAFCLSLIMVSTAVVLALNNK